MPSENIFANAPGIKSVEDWQAERDARALRQVQLQGAQRQNALADMLMQQQIGDMRDKQARSNALRAVLSDPSITTPQQREEAMLRNPYLMDQGQAAQKARIDAEKTQAETADKRKSVQMEQRKQLFQTVGSLNSPEDAMQLINASVADGTLPMPAATVIGRMVQSDPKWQVKLMMMIGDPDKARDVLLPHLQTTNIGGSTVMQAVDRITGMPTTTGTIKNTQSPDNAANNATTRRGQDMTDARARELNAITKEGQQTQVINDPERGILLVNKGTGLTRPALGMDGKAVPSENAAKSTKQWGQLGESINMARELLPGATASGAGAMVDKAANFFGKSTDGADAAAKLRTLAGWMTSNVPRMEGPQSDKDTANYRIMAGQVGDETLPTSQRLAALDALEEIRSRYAGNGAPKTKQAPGAFADPEKERRYQEWKRQQGQR